MPKFVIDDKNDKVKLFLKQEGGDVCLMAKLLNGSDAHDYYVLTINEEGTLSRHSGYPKEMGIQVDDCGKIKINK